MSRENIAASAQSRAAIEPGEVAEIVLRCLGTHDGVAEAGVFAGGVIDVLADGAGEQLHPGSAWKALGAIGFERGYVVFMRRQHMRQAWYQQIYFQPDFNI